MKIHLFQFTAISGLARASQAAILSCSTNTFANAIPSNATLTYVKHIQENGTFGDSHAMSNATSLPEGCAVGVEVPSSSNSSYSLALYLPSSWNNRFLAVGNAGYGGFTAWSDIGIYAHYGFAAVSTNTGHDGGFTTSDWALNKESLTVCASRCIRHASSEP